MQCKESVRTPIEMANGTSLLFIMYCAWWVWNFEFQILKCNWSCTWYIQIILIFALWKSFYCVITNALNSFFLSFASCNGCLANCCHAILLNLAFVENRCLFSRIFRYFEHYSIWIVFLPFCAIRKMKGWNKLSLWTYCQCTDVHIIDVNLWSFFLILSETKI